MGTRKNTIREAVISAKPPALHITLEAVITVKPSALSATLETVSITVDVVPSISDACFEAETETAAVPCTKTASIAIFCTSDQRREKLAQQPCGGKADKWKGIGPGETDDTVQKVMRSAISPHEGVVV